MNKQISLQQRYQIAALIEAGTKKSQIAKIIGFSKTSIYKEINRNGKRMVKDSFYYADFADRLCRKRHELKNKKIKLTVQVKRRIRWLIKCLWSPEQIAKAYKIRAIEMVSIESIYRYLYKLKRQGIDLCKYLRRHHRKRRKRSNNKHSSQIIKDKVSINKRPKAANKASTVGHMEIDLM